MPMTPAKAQIAREALLRTWHEVPVKPVPGLEYLDALGFEWRLTAEIDGVMLYTRPCETIIRREAYTPYVIVEAVGWTFTKDGRPCYDLKGQIYPHVEHFRGTYERFFEEFAGIDIEKTFLVLRQPAPDAGTSLEAPSETEDAAEIDEPARGMTP